jgi:hypothetical protein
VIPLNYDGYLLTTLQSGGPAPIATSTGAVEGVLQLAPGSSPTLIGVEAHHAGIVLDPVTLAPVGVSAPRALCLVP